MPEALHTLQHDTAIIASLEFATKLVGAKPIVVFGHSEFGAIKSAVSNAQMSPLKAILTNIRPAVLKVKGIEGPQDSKNKKLVQTVADQNAADAAALLTFMPSCRAPRLMRVRTSTLTARSEVLRQLVREGQLKIVAAMHDIATGNIHWKV